MRPAIRIRMRLYNCQMHWEVQFKRNLWWWRGLVFKTQQEAVDHVAPFLTHARYLGIEP